MYAKIQQRFQERYELIVRRSRELQSSETAALEWPLRIPLLLIGRRPYPSDPDPDLGYLQPVYALVEAPSRAARFHRYIWITCLPYILAPPQQKASSPVASASRVPLAAIILQSVRVAALLP